LSVRNPIVRQLEFLNLDCGYRPFGFMLSTSYLPKPGTAGSTPISNTLFLGLTPILKHFEEALIDYTSNFALYAAGPGPIDFEIGILSCKISAFF
jgi:hypothetical protein